MRDATVPLRDVGPALEPAGRERHRVEDPRVSLVADRDHRPRRRWRTGGAGCDPLRRMGVGAPLHEIIVTIVAGARARGRAPHENDRDPHSRPSQPCSKYNPRVGGATHRRAGSARGPAAASSAERHADPDEPVGERGAGLEPFNLPRSGRQSSSTMSVVSPSRLGRVALEMLRPEPDPRGACEPLVAADDVHLGVVEQGVVVEVRRADGEPAVVDDADLRVHVDGLAEPPARGRACRPESGRSVVGVEQRAELTARVVSRRCSVAPGSSTTSRNASLGGSQQLAHAGRRRSRATRGTGSRGRRAARPTAARAGRPRGSRTRRPASRGRSRSGTVRTICTSSRPRARPASGGQSVSPVTSLPAKPEVLATSRDDGPVAAGRRVVPAERAALRMVGASKPVAAEVGEVDAADERVSSSTIDDLLVMAVHRPLVAVERDMHARPRPRRASSGRRRCAGRAEERQRRAGPREHAHVDTLRELASRSSQRPGRGPRAARKRARRTSRRGRPAPVPRGARAPWRAAPRRHRRRSRCRAPAGGGAGATRVRSACRGSPPGRSSRGDGDGASAPRSRRGRRPSSRRVSATSARPVMPAQILR